MEPERHPVLEDRPWLERLIGTVPGVRWLVGGIATVSIACAVIMRLLDSSEFPSFGLAFWWSIQTVTTVGYGDVTPKTTEGRFIASVLMLSAVAAISLLTAAIAAGMVNRVQRRRAESHEDPVIKALDRIEQRLDRLEKRLESS